MMPKASKKSQTNNCFNVLVGSRQDPLEGSSLKDTFHAQSKREALLQNEPSTFESKYTNMQAFKNCKPFMGVLLIRVI